MVPFCASFSLASRTSRTRKIHPRAMEVVMRRAETRRMNFPLRPLQNFTSFSPTVADKDRLLTS